jgi:cobalt/nickel transport system permease protein
MICIFIGAAIGDLSTYCMTALQLSIAYPSEVGGIQSSFIKFFSIFAVTQVPLAVIEGILTVLVIMTLESYANQELKEIGFIRNTSL